MARGIEAVLQIESWLPGCLFHRCSAIRSVVDSSPNIQRGPSSFSASSSPESVRPLAPHIPWLGKLPGDIAGEGPAFEEEITANVQKGRFRVEGKIQEGKPAATVDGLCNFRRTRSPEGR